MAETGPPSAPHWEYALVRDAVRWVPAYRRFLVDSGRETLVNRADDAYPWTDVPVMTKAAYVSRYPLAERCRGGELTSADMVAVSSGSTGAPTIWPRSAADEAAAVAEMRRVLVDGFRCDERRTLAVVCFPLGTWVGGLYTLSCVRAVAAEGHPIVAVAPGNTVSEILRVLPELAPQVDQVVLFGYPPFVKTVLDAGNRRGLPWPGWHLKLVFAGESFSERWRDLVAQRCGIADPVRSTASLYGTADAGILATETPTTVGLRRFLSGNAELRQELFGSDVLPALFEYDPAHRLFEADGPDLLFTADGTTPLIRYSTGDRGGLLDASSALAACRESGYAATQADAEDKRLLYLFGRTLFSVSFSGANVYPEMVAPVLEREELAPSVTGKFVIQVREHAEDTRLEVVVELAENVDATTVPAPEDLAEAIRGQLVATSSEYRAYVEPTQQRPTVVLRAFGDPEYFPVGVKHRYTRGG